MPRKIVTEFIHPPIPLRQFDWIAVDDNLGEDSPQGYGRTEREAVEALMEQLED